MTNRQQHGPYRVMCDVLGRGFVIECVCGDQTAPEMTMTDAGAQFDDHLSEMGAHPYWQHEAGVLPLDSSGDV